MAQFIRVVTQTGFMQVTLNGCALLVAFRLDENTKPLRTLQLTVQNPKVVYDDGWHLNILNWLVETYQPTPLMWLKSSMIQVSHNSENEGGNGR